MKYQNFALYPHLTVYENLAYPLHVAGLDSRAVSNRVGEVADRFGRNHILKRKLNTASGGEQQRRAIVMIFQPFSKLAFTAGCVLVVLGGLAFHLVPLGTPGRPLRSLSTSAAVVMAVFLVVVMVALGSAHLYGVYPTG